MSVIKTDNEYSANGHVTEIGFSIDVVKVKQVAKIAANLPVHFALLGGTYPVFAVNFGKGIVSAFNASMNTWVSAADDAFENTRDFAFGYVANGN